MAASASTATTTFDVHRCRFVDYVPASITAIAVPPTPLPRVRSAQKAAAPSGANIASKFPPIAVSRGNGNIELYEWSGVGETAQASPQAWILHKTLYAPAPSKVDTLVWILREPSSLRAGQAPTLADLRLFSAGGGNEVLEWNLDSGTIARSLSSQGGSIWSMSANPASTILALGCEDGSIRLVSVADNTLEHKRKFDRVKTRLLSLAWGPPRPPAPRKPLTAKPGTTASDASDSNDSDDDEEEEWSDSWILAGCSDSTLRKWDCASGRVLDRMLVDRRKGERTLVWAVAVLGDGTMVSGDSMGNVRFWDAATCTQLQSYQLHGADVLCLAVGPEGRSIYSAGVDQKICQFSRVEIASGDDTSSRWIHSATRRYHIHDVRALATWPAYTPLPPSVTIPTPSGRVISSLLFSGGLDISLNIKPCMLPFERSQPTRVLNPIKTSSETSFENSWQLRRNYSSKGLMLHARDARLLMLVRDRGVSVWRLSKLQNTSDDSDELGLQALLHDPEATDGGWTKVLDMQLNVSTNLCCGAISDDGQWLAVADMYETKLFRLDHKGEVTKPRRVKNLTSKLLPHVASGSEDELSTGATALSFSPDSSKLVLATSLSSYTLIIDLASVHDDFDNIRVLRRFDQHRLRDVAQPFSSAVPRQINGHAQANGDAAMDVDQTPSDEESDGAIAHQEIRLAGSYETQIRRVTHISFSPDGQWLATSDERRRVHVYNMDSIQHQCVLPVFDSDVVALLFDPARTHNLVVVLATNRIRVFDVEAGSFPIWARALCDTIPAQVTNRRESVVGACFTRTRSRAGAPAPALVLWANDWFCHIRLDADVPPPVPSRQTKRTRDGLAADAVDADDQSDVDDEVIVPRETGTAAGVSSQSQPQRPRTFIFSDTHYRPVLFMGFFGDGDLVVVERPHADIMAGLAPAFYKQRYGAS